MKKFFLIIIAFIYATVISATETLTLAQQTEAVNAVKTYFSTLQEYAKNPMGEEGLQLRNDIVLMFENILNTPVYNDLALSKNSNATDLSCSIEDYLLELGILSEENAGNIHISYSNINCKTILEPSYTKGYDDKNALISVDKTIKIGNQEEMLSNIIRYNITKKRISYIEKKTLSTSESDIELLLNNNEAYSTSKIREMASRCYSEKKYNQAYKLFEKAAIRNDIYAQLDLVKLLISREGCEEYGLFATNEMAKFWIKRIYSMYVGIDGIAINDSFKDEIMRLIARFYGTHFKFIPNREEVPFNSNLMLYQESEQDCYFFDKSGKAVFNQKYKQASAFSEGMAVVSIDGENFGCINNKGEIIIPMIYADITPFVNGTATASLLETKDGVHKVRYFLINKRGEQISEEYDYIGWRDNKDEMLLIAKRNGKYGFINGFGEIKIPFVFDNYQKNFSFQKSNSDFLVSVMQNGKWGFVDVSSSEGKIVIYPQYAKVTTFAFGRAIVCEDYSVFFIDKNGKRVTEKYKSATPFNACGITMVTPIEETDQSLRHFIDKNGNIIYYANQYKKGTFENLRRKK